MQKVWIQPDSVLWVEDLSSNLHYVPVRQCLTGLHFRRKGANLVGVTPARVMCGHEPERVIVIGTSSSLDAPTSNQKESAI